MTLRAAFATIAGLLGFVLYVGVAVALVSWMIVLAFALVACATAGAWAAHTFLLHDKPPTVPGGRSGEP